MNQNEEYVHVFIERVMSTSLKQSSVVWKLNILKIETHRNK